MSEEMTKAELLAQIRAERDRLGATLAQVDEARMGQPGVVGVWSVKDLLAHIAAWEALMVGWLEEIQRGEVPEALAPGSSWDGLDALNEEFFQANRHRSLDDVRAEFHASFQRVWTVVEEAPEELLLDAEQAPWREGHALWKMVAANTFWHYREHRESMDAWLATGAGDSGA